MELNSRNFWFEGKAWFESQIGMLNDQLHVHLGLFVFLTRAVLLRRRRHGMILAWTVVAALQATNEAFDARDWINWTGTVNWSETIKDSVATLFWPTVLLLIWRWVKV